MTLIVTAACAEFVVQVSDRRFTYLDSKLAQPATDEGNKELVVRAADADLAVSFTGLADLEGEPTGDWLVERISEAKAAESGFDACVEAVRTAAQESFARLSERTERVYPHSFVLAGFMREPKRPRVTVVTNCESHDFRRTPPEGEFAAHSMKSATYVYHATGYVPALANDAKPRIRGLLRKAANYPAVTDAIVEEIRKAGRHKKHGKYVGQQCMSVCVFRSGEIEAIYHATHRQAIVYAPNLIDTVPAKGGGLGHMLMKGVAMGGALQDTPFPLGLGSTKGGVRVGDRRLLRRARPGRTEP